MAKSRALTQEERRRYGLDDSTTNLTPSSSVVEEERRANIQAQVNAPIPAMPTPRSAADIQAQIDKNNAEEKRLAGVAYLMPTNENREALAAIRKQTEQLNEELYKTTNGESGKVGFFHDYSFMPSSGEDFARRFGYNAERAAAGLLGFGENVLDFVGTGFYKGVEGLTSLGGLAPNAVSQWAGNAAQKYLDESVTEDYKASIKERYNPTIGEENVAGITETAAQILGSIASGQIFSKVASGLNAFSTAADTAKNAAAASKGAFGLSAAGGGANEAYRDGASVGKSLAYGAAIGTMETAIESIAGGIPGFGDGKISSIAKKILNNPAVSKMLDVLGEGGEEALSAIVTPFIKRAVYDPNAKNASIDEIVENAVMGMVLSGVLNAGISLPQRLNIAKSQDVANPLAPATGNEVEAATDAPETNSAQIAENEAQTAPSQETQTAAADVITESEAAFDKLVDEKTAEGTVGAAALGFTTPDAKSVERTGRLAETLKYNKHREAATGLTKDEYNEIFRYMSQSEDVSMKDAENLLYFEVDGNRTFLKDVDEGSYRELVDSLAYATAWNAAQTDAAYMIQEELMRRSIDMEIEETEYTDFLEMMDEHLRETGRGVQANAKWSRGDNRSGHATELDAWKELEKSNLTDAEKRERFRSIVEFDHRINSVKAGDVASMKDIVMDIATQRGVLSGAVTGKQATQTTKIANSALDKLTFDQLKQFAFSSSAAYASDAIKVDAGKKFKAIQVLNMLSNLKTPATNLTGNTSFYLLDALAMDGATLLDMAVSQVTGTRSVAKEASPFSRQTMQNALKAMNMSLAEIALDVDMGGESTRYGTGSSRTFKAGGVGAFGTNKNWDKFVERVISTFERNQAYLMVAPDEFFKGAARASQQNTQNLVSEGKIKTADKEYAKKQADQLAKYRTFQDDSSLSTMIRGLHDSLNLIGFGDSGQRMNGKVVHSFGFGDVVAPFVRVAGNLAERGLDYSPVGAVRGIAEIGEQVYNAAKGNDVNVSKQAKGVADLARGITGSALAAGFMLLVKAGIMRKEDDEESADVAALNQSEGISGTQININAIGRWISGESAEWQYGDKLVDLSRIQPLNLVMNLGALLAEDELSVASVYDATIGAFTDSAAELPVLQFIGNAGERIIKYNEKPTEVLAQEAANTLLSSLIPNAVRAIAKGIDDRPRNTYTGDSLAENIRDNFFNAIPGLRQMLPGSVNTMGEEKVYQDGAVENFINSTLNPINVNTYTQSDVSKEMERVRKETGEKSFYPNKIIPSSVQYTDDNDRVHRVDMTYEQRQQYQRDRGTTQMIVTADVMGSSTYKNATPADQAALLNDCAEYASWIAKANVLGDEAAPAWVINARNSGNPEAYIQYKHIADGKASQSATAEALEKVAGISDAERGKIWSQERNPDGKESTEAKNPFTGALPQAGISTSVSVDILAKYSQIDKSEIPDREKSAQFEDYIKSLGLSREQIKVVGETFLYFGRYPIKW